MKKQLITILLLAITFSLSAQNTDAEKEAMYYIKKAYQHRKDKDKTEALKYLNVFEEYLQKNLKPENVGDSIALYYGNTIAELAANKDEDKAINNHFTIKWATVYKYLHRFANQGQAEAQNIIGDCFYNNQKNSDAIEWYRKSAQQDNSLGQYNLGRMYYNGFGTKKDYIEAEMWYRKSAENGNANSQYFLALMYMDGVGVTQDYSEAIKWLRKAAEQGHIYGQYYLGYMFDYGLGGIYNSKEAAFWYRKAALQGNPSAQNQLGWAYENGYGVPKDYEEAIKWYKRSANQGNSSAQYSLSRILVEKK